MLRLTSLLLVTFLASAHAQDWGTMATISSTMGTNAGCLCIGEASRGDIGCPSYAPTVSATGTLNTTAVSLTTSGVTWGYLASTASYVPNLASNAISATNISATTLNGIAISQLAGGSSSTIISGVPDAILCSVSSNNFILYSIGQTSSGNYFYRLPQDPTSGSDYAIAFTSAGAYSTHSNMTGSNCLSKSLTQLYSEGKAFNLIGTGGAAPTGQIAAFDLAACPTGWSEYTAARGRFLRGIDSTGTTDPSGVRTAGATQEDAMQGHKHNALISAYIASGSYSAPRFSVGSDSSGVIGDPITDGTNGTPRTSSETRPKNVAVLFCRKN